MDSKSLVTDLLTTLKPFEAQIAKSVWEGVLHPYLKAQEAKIGSSTLALVAGFVDTELDTLIEAEIAKLSA